MGRWDTAKEPDLVELMHRRGMLKPTKIHPITRGVMVQCEHCEDWRYFGVVCSRCVLIGVLCDKCGDENPCARHKQPNSTGVK